MSRVIPVNASTVAAAVDAMRFVLDYEYTIALKTELEVCLAPCKTDEERAQVFVRLMPHLKRQVERKNKQDSARFHDRIYAGRTW